MSKYRSLILVISISVLFSGLVSAQEAGPGDSAAGENRVEGAVPE